MMALVAAATVMMAAQGTFAAGGAGKGGIGISAGSTAGTGRPAGDGMTSTGISGTMRSGGVGTTGSRPSLATGLASDSNYRTGSSFKMAGGKGFSSTATAQGKTFNVPMIRGVGTVAASPGGLGL
jgi:hypothetical protein